MKKISTMVLILSVAFLISGGYALMNENVTSLNDIPENDVVYSNDINPSSYDKTFTDTILTNTISANTMNQNSSIDNEKIPVLNYVYKNQIYTLSTDSDKLNNKYIQCAECGKYIPVGNVNNLPEDALCSEFRGFVHADPENTYSYEEAYDSWNTNIKNNPNYDQNKNFHNYNDIDADYQNNDESMDTTQDIEQNSVPNFKDSTILCT